MNRDINHYETTVNAIDFHIVDLLKEQIRLEEKIQFLIDGNNMLKYQIRMAKESGVTAFDNNKYRVKEYRKSIKDGEKRRQRNQKARAKKCTK